MYGIAILSIIVVDQFTDLDYNVTIYYRIGFQADNLRNERKEDKAANLVSFEQYHS